MSCLAMIPFMHVLHVVGLEDWKRPRPFKILFALTLYALHGLNSDTISQGTKISLRFLSDS